jgi:hypothetical protein
MSNGQKIEFYKRRSVGEVLSAAADFLRQNWKILYKNILIIGVPLAILQGIFLRNYVAITLTATFNGLFFLNALAVFIVFLLLSLFLYSITATIINRYGEGTLTENAKWVDLKEEVYSYAGKTFLIGVLLFIAIFVLSIFAGIIIGGMAAFSAVVAVVFTIIIVGLFIAFAPGLSLILFPAYFHGETAWSSFTTGISLGFRHWGTTFLVLLVSGIVTAVFSVVLSVPFQLWQSFNLLFPAGVIGMIISYIFAILSSLAGLISIPVLLVFLSFQYFNVVEKEEGVSVQSGVDEFDNL